MSRVLSSLLSIRESGLVFSLLGSECSASACAVVQLLLATQASKGIKSEWQIHSCGVVCLVQDKKLHSTFIRLFCVKKAKLLWEQELYTPFTYSAPRPFFHTFPSDECWVGLNFTDEDEASRFYTAIQISIGTNKARSTFVRTHSLDSASGWLLRNKLNTCLTLSRATSSNASPSVKSEMTQTLSLAQRKGPLPPIPQSRDAASSHSNHQNLSVPIPPPFPAPNLNINPVKKSASFSPGRNHNFPIEKQQRSLRCTDNR